MFCYVSVGVPLSHVFAIFSGWLDLKRIENVNVQCVSFHLISSHRYHMFNIFCIIARISSGPTSMAFLGKGG